MSKYKSREKKEFLISQRKKQGPGYLNTPVWIIQKSGKRIWNRKSERNWRRTKFGDEYKKQVHKTEISKKKSPIKSGKIQKSAKYKPKTRTRNTTDLSQYRKHKKTKTKK